MKILVIEDDEDTLNYIATGLLREGHLLETCNDGKDGLFLALNESYDIIIIDRMLPNLDGLSVLKSIRGAKIHTPALFLTTMSGIKDRVEGLEAGGDDYLVKPFAFSELRARINALARRPPISENNTIIRLADLEIDIARHTVTRAGQTIDLQPLEFRLLEYFMRHKGQIVTRTMLLENVWNFYFDPKTKVVEANISRLRSKLDKPFDHSLLHTYRGLGYMLKSDRDELS